MIDITVQPGPPPSAIPGPSRARYIAHLRGSGMTLNAIARHLGLSRQRVHQILHPQPKRAPAPAADAIRALRTQLKLSQQEFAELIGVSFAAVNRWENGRASPGLQARQRLMTLWPTT